MKHARSYLLEIKFCAHSLIFLTTTTTKICGINAMADDKNTSNFTVNINGPSIASSAAQPFHVQLHFIDKNTTIDSDFAQKYYQYYQYFDLTQQRKKVVVRILSCHIPVVYQSKVVISRSLWYWTYCWYNKKSCLPVHIPAVFVYCTYTKIIKIW